MKVKRKYNVKWHDTPSQEEQERRILQAYKLNLIGVEMHEVLNACKLDQHSYNQVKKRLNGMIRENFKEKIENILAVWFESKQLILTTMLSKALTSKQTGDLTAANHIMDSMFDRLQDVGILHKEMTPNINILQVGQQNTAIIPANQAINNFITALQDLNYANTGNAVKEVVGESK